MELLTFDMRLAVYSGPAPRDLSPMLFAHLRSSGHERPGHSSELLLLCRDECGVPPPWISRSTVNDGEVAELVTLVCAAGFPTRPPRVVANRGAVNGTRTFIALDVKLYGRRSSWTFLSEGAGLSGEDAKALRELLGLIANLAEAGGRPAFGAVVNHVIGDPAIVRAAVN